MPSYTQEMADETVNAIVKRASDSERRFKNILTNISVMNSLKQELRVCFSRASNKMLFDYYVYFLGKLKFRSKIPE